MAAATVFIVDDNAEMRRSLARFLKEWGLITREFDSAQAFLDAYDPQESGCLLLDIHMPGMSGCELQESLNNSGVKLPVIIVSGHGVVRDVVRAMRMCPFEFIEKPFEPKQLLARVREAIEYDVESRKAAEETVLARKRYEKLTPREKQILAGVVSGRKSKVLASELGVSTSTIDNHRANIMKKLKAESPADLTRISLLVDPGLAFGPSEPRPQV